MKGVKYYPGEQSLFVRFDKLSLCRIPLKSSVIIQWRGARALVFVLRFVVVVNMNVGVGAVSFLISCIMINLKGFFK